MKYITSVNDNSDIKHIVEANGSTHEVIEGGKPEQYGPKKGETTFLANGINVSRDLMITIPNSKFAHLAQAVLGIELVRFVIESVPPTENKDK